VGCSRNPVTTTMEQAANVVMKDRPSAVGRGPEATEFGGHEKKNSEFGSVVLALQTREILRTIRQRLVSFRLKINVSAIYR